MLCCLGPNACAGDSEIDNRPLCLADAYAGDDIYIYLYDVMHSMHCMLNVFQP